LQGQQRIGLVWIALVGVALVVAGCSEDSSSQASVPVVKKAPVSPGGPRQASQAKTPEPPGGPSQAAASNTPTISRSGFSQQTGSKSAAAGQQPTAGQDKNKSATQKAQQMPPKDQGTIALKEPEPRFIYRPGNRRDPFQPFFMEARQGEVLAECAGVPRGPLTEVEATQFSLVAIVKRGQEWVAMVQDREGKGYVLREGTYIGKKCGQVARIGPEGVVIEEPYRDLLGEKKMRKVVLDFKAPGGGG
jgi:Tfp pilus assembly protein PilP